MFNAEMDNRKRLITELFGSDEESEETGEDETSQVFALSIFLSENTFRRISLTKKYCLVLNYTLNF